jgi:hypothetical protein
MLTAGGLTACALLLLPAAYYGLARLFRKPAVPLLPVIARMRPRFWILAFPPLLALGYVVSSVPALAFLLLPVLHVVVVAIPIAWMAYLGVRGLPLGSEQRAWGVFGAGLTLGPALIMLLEGLVIGGMAALAIVYMIGRPDLAMEMQRLSIQLQRVQQDEEAVLSMLTPYLQNPRIIFSVIAFASVFVPIIEEALKPVGVWLLAGRNMTPQAGLAMGVLSGAGYALMESLLLAANSNQWSGLMVARIGTSAMHIFNTGVMGYAIVLAVRRRRYLQLGLTYLGVIALHGLWNAITMWIAFSNLSGEQPGGMLGLPGGLSLGLPLLLVSLAMFSFGGLLWMNYRVAQAAKQPGAADLPL